MTRHECAVPAGGSKRRSWRCPTCRQVWDFSPRSSAPGLFGWLFKNARNANGSKPSMLGKDQ